MHSPKYPLFSLFVDNKKADDSSYIKYRVLDIIYEKSFENLEQLILNDSNINDMLNNNQTLEIKNLAFEYYKNQEQIIIIKLSQNLTYEGFIEKKCSNSNTDLNRNFENKLFKELCLKALINPHKNYVLVLENYQIGNIDNIFENIKYLFESSKRLGNRAELKVKLKYENCDFGIPNNLYILGIISKCE